MVFRRRGLGFAVRDPGYLTAEYPNINGFLFMPGTAGLRQQHEPRDGTYTLDDLADAAGLIRVRRENYDEARR